jgi:hypothetical protein
MPLMHIKAFLILVQIPWEAFGIFACQSIQIELIVFKANGIISQILSLIGVMRLPILYKCKVKLIHYNNILEEKILKKSNTHSLRVNSQGIALTWMRWMSFLFLKYICFYVYLKYFI